MAILDSFYANPIQFANEAWPYAFLSIIPLIIIYLLRPRAKKLKIPSLMFLLDIEKKKRLNIFRKFLKDPLFLIQLLALIIISLAIAAPYIITNEEAGGSSTVIILDASASMQADGRFGKAVEEANKFLSAKNTIILAESIPVIVIEDSPSSSASDALSKLKAKATGVDLSSAILLGRRNLTEGGRIVVLSDFISSNGDSPVVARKLAESKGIRVDFITVSGKTDNIGIINGWFEKNDYKIEIKNFKETDQDVNIDVTINGKNLPSNSLNIKAHSSTHSSISDLKLNPGITKISIDSQDALPVDNNAFVFIPSSEQRDVLYITENPKSPSFVALGLISNTKLTKADPKSIPSLSGKIVIVSAAISPDAVKKLEDHVSGGGTALIIASAGLHDMDMLPVELSSFGNKTSLNIAHPNTMTTGTDIENTLVFKYFKTHFKNGAVALVTSSDKEGSPMLAFWNFGKGKVIYLGLSDPQGNIYDPENENVWNDFHTRSRYPIFWKQLLDWIEGSSDPTEYNAKTGMQMKFPSSETMKTPLGDKVTTATLLFDEVGIYEFPGKSVAVNLFDEGESNLESGGIAEMTSNVSAAKEPIYSVETVRKPKNLDIYFIIGAMFLVFLELYYLHWRGEL